MNRRAFLIGIGLGAVATRVAPSAGYPAPPPYAWHGGLAGYDDTAQKAASFKRQLKPLNMGRLAPGAIYTVAGEYNLEWMGGVTVHDGKINLWEQA